MSILDLHKDVTQTITIDGAEFEFTKPSTAQYLKLFGGGSAEQSATAIADIIADNIVGEDLTVDQVLETFDFDELGTIGVALIEGFSGIDEAGKP